MSPNVSFSVRCVWVGCVWIRISSLEGGRRASQLSPGPRYRAYLCSHGGGEESRSLEWSLRLHWSCLCLG